jgi:hypothetical protein
MTKNTEALTWNSGTPLKRGAYRVKSDGPTANSGYRYWNGERWGPLCNKRKYATRENTERARRTPVRYPILWASKVTP